VQRRQAARRTLHTGTRRQHAKQLQQQQLHALLLLFYPGQQQLAASGGLLGCSGTGMLLCSEALLLVLAGIAAQGGTRDGVSGLKGGRRKCAAVR
jgi:hypothetical protein